MQTSKKLHNLGSLIFLKIAINDKKQYPNVGAFYVTLSSECETVSMNKKLCFLTN